MNTDQLVRFLDDPGAAAEWLEDLGIKDVSTAHQRLIALADTGITLDLLCEISEQLSLHLPTSGSADRALATLARFVEASRSPISFGTLIEQDQQALPVLLRLFAASPVLGDWLVEDPAAYDLLRVTEGQPATRESLQTEMENEVDQLVDTGDVMKALRSFKRRETLRIAYGDIIAQQPLAVVTEQLTFLADSICGAAMRAAERQLVSKRGHPRLPRTGEASRCVLIGLGRFGGQELAYDARLRVLFIYEADGKTDGRRPIDNFEFYDQLITRTAELLSEPTELGTAYELDFSQSPTAKTGKSCLSLKATLDHYETRGRTWERQALIKSRCVAGDLNLGHAFLDAVEPWIYRRYLSRSDISGIKALKRKLERHADSRAGSLFDVDGGIHDLEFVVQYLQLINGGDAMELRVANTLNAIGQLEQTGCITPEESRTLETNYLWLRQTEHRQEVLQPSRTLSDEEYVGQLATHCGYPGADGIQRFREECRAKSAENKQLIARLLEDTFSEDGDFDPASDLIMDPAPTEDRIEQVLRPFAFRDPIDAYHQLNALADEGVLFLSSRRCRHFLALIATPLLKAISQTPSPDATLANLCRVSDSIGGKGVLWGLFHTHPPSLDLYVRLCSSSAYLTSILTRYPGMIDELFDSLMLAELPSLGELQATLDDLCEPIDDIEPVLHSFKNTQHLNVGVRELLGKTGIEEATAALADVAQACVQRIANDQYRKLVHKYGQPRIGTSDQPAEMVILAMGKFGGREPNYHSDVDMVFLFEAEGSTSHPNTIRNRETTSNQHFFSELGQRITKTLSEHGPHGQLYSADARLRPLDASGPVAVSLEQFRDHYLSVAQPFSELRRYCQARPVFGSEPLRARVTDVLREILSRSTVLETDAESVKRERLEIQSAAGPRNIKRGPGGTLDIEFLNQLLQLRHASQDATILHANTLTALQAFRASGILSEEDAEFLCESYRFLRSVEAKLRLINTTARHDLPREEDELAKLAYLLRFPTSSKLESACAERTRKNRQLFDRLIATG